MDILVVGAGVTGLTTAISLLRAGHKVTIWAKHFALEDGTVSNVAAATWYPYRVGGAKAQHWAKEALEVFTEMVRSDTPGITMASVLDLMPVPTADPWWASIVRGFRHARPSQLPDGYADAFIFEAPVMDMHAYLNHLQRTYEHEGGAMERRGVRNWDEAFAAGYRLVANCAGLGAQLLARDESELRPARGQVVRIKPNGFQWVIYDDYGPNSISYVIPRANDIVLGGTYEEHNTDPNVDLQQTLDILDRCANLVDHFHKQFAESLRSVRRELLDSGTSTAILGVACGLRPMRSSVRVEVEEIESGRWVIHNYGHGGAGVALSWGCAKEATELAGALHA